MLWFTTFSVVRVIPWRHVYHSYIVLRLPSPRSPVGQSMPAYQAAPRSMLPTILGCDRALSSLDQYRIWTGPCYGSNAAVVYCVCVVLLLWPSWTRCLERECFAHSLAKCLSSRRERVRTENVDSQRRGKQTGCCVGSRTNPHVLIARLLRAVIQLGKYIMLAPLLAFSAATRP